MAIMRICIAVLCVVFFSSGNTYARRGGGRSTGHTRSHGGSYKGGRGSSHKGGTYKNKRTSDHYRKHK